MYRRLVWRRYFLPQRKFFDLHGLIKMRENRHETNGKTVPSRQRKKQHAIYVILSAITVLIAAMLFGVAALVCGVQFSVYMRLVFIPFFAFSACFVNCLIAEKCKWMPAVVLAVCLISYLVFCTLSLSVFPYLLLYGINGALGFLIGRLINSYHKQ